MKPVYKELPESSFVMIRIPFDYAKRPPRPEKLIRKVLDFWREGELADIVVDHKMFLVDGYCSYLIAREVGTHFVKIKQIGGADSGN